MAIPKGWKLLTEREILGKLYERIVALEEVNKQREAQLRREEEQEEMDWYDQSLREAQERN